MFRVNNNRAGYIGYGKSSTSFGYNALNPATTGNYNTATGTFALAANTSGNNNTSNGSYVLVNNTSGSYNAAFGSDALHNNTTERIIQPSVPQLFILIHQVIKIRPLVLVP